MKEFNVEVLGQQYSVKCGTRKECNMPMDLEGQCYNMQKRIHINMVNDQEPDETDVEREERIKNTAAHEVFHAFCTESGIYLPGDIEEQLATFYGQQWQKLHSVTTQILEGMGDEL